MSKKLKLIAVRMSEEDFALLQKAKGFSTSSKIRHLIYFYNSKFQT